MPSARRSKKWPGSTSPSRPFSMIRKNGSSAAKSARSAMGAFTMPASSRVGFWLTGLRERQALPGLVVEVGRERPLLRDGDVAGQVGRIGRADDRGGQAGVAEREAQDELHIAHARFAQEAGDAGGLPVPLADAGVLAQRPGPPVFVLRRGAARRAAPDERARARVGGLGD